MKLEKIVKLTQEELYIAIKKHYKNKLLSCAEGEYITVKGDIPVMLVAHLDTVHQEIVKHICKSDDGNIIMSPQGIGGDDRCGVFALMQIYKNLPSGNKPYLLFTCDEETGGNGAYAFAQDFENGSVDHDLYDMNFLIEIDRMGLMEAVYYDCDNPDFEDVFLGYGFDTHYGTFSDICYIAPIMGCASVNLSAGYYNAHTYHEYINIDHLMYTVDCVTDLLLGDVEYFEYIETDKKWKNVQGWDWCSGYDSDLVCGNYTTSKEKK